MTSRNLTFILSMNDMDCFERDWLNEHIYWVISQYCDLDDLDGELIDEIAENLEDEDNVTDEKIIRCAQEILTNTGTSDII